MKQSIYKLTLTTVAILSTVISMTSCADKIPAYENKMYTHSFNIEDETDFNIDLSYPVFDGNYEKLNQTIEEQKQSYIAMYENEFESTWQMHMVEMELPSKIGFHILYDVVANDDGIYVVFRNSYYLVGAAHDHTDVTVIHYNPKTETIDKEVNYH